MDSFEFLNTYFNMIYHNESAFVRDIISSPKYINDYARILRDNNIETICLSSIFEHDISLIYNCRTLSEVDSLLHINLKEEVEQIAQRFKDKTYALYIPGLNNEEFIRKEYQTDSFRLFTVKHRFTKKDLSFLDPFLPLYTALSNVDYWPGILLFNSQKTVFIPINNEQEYDNFLNHVKNNEDLFQLYPFSPHDSYYLQISDLHLGKEKNNQASQRLIQSIDTIIPYLNTNYQYKFLITGDLMESPNRKNMYLANDFMNLIKKKYKANVTFVLGNHDVIVHGLNLFKRQKSKVIAYLLGEHIKVIENEKVILLKMDTTSQGNLARGMIGQRQLEEINDELEAIENLNDYTIFVLIHHHICPIDKAQFIKTRWHEKTFINKLLDSSKALIDAPQFIQWLNNHHVKYVFHGHKHLPFFKIDDGKYYISAGSATGSLKESDSRYLSYNIVKYDTFNKELKTCLIIYDDKGKQERQRVEVYLFEEE